MRRSSIQLTILSFSCLILVSGCTSAFDKCVEAKQEEFKKEHPDENYENLVREREVHERECQSQK